MPSPSIVNSWQMLGKLPIWVAKFSDFPEPPVFVYVLNGLCERRIVLEGIDDEETEVILDVFWMERCHWDGVP